jgi:hypothetical protein
MRNDNFLDTCPHQSFSARWGAPKMIARLQSHIRNCSVRGVPFGFSIVNRHLFCVKTTKVVVPPFSDDVVILDKNAANQWIW